MGTFSRIYSKPQHQKWNKSHPDITCASTHEETKVTHLVDTLGAEKSVNICFLTLFYMIQDLFSIFHLSPGAARVAASIESKKTAFIIVADLLKFI